MIPYKLTTKTQQLILLLCTVTILNGCAAAGAISTVAQLAANATGFNKPIDANATKDVLLKIQADKKLNTDTHNNPYAVVVRIYHLKQSTGFQQAFYGAFLDPQKEKEALGTDVIAIKEITLIPGQNYTNTEKINITAESIGIVAFFQTPAAARWKLTFPTNALNKNGIALGLSACSITVSSGTTAEYNATTQNTLKTPANCG